MIAVIAICPVCDKPLEKLHGNKDTIRHAYAIKRNSAQKSVCTNMLRHDPYWDNERILKQFALGWRKELTLNLWKMQDLIFEFFKERKMLNGKRFIWCNNMVLF